MTDIGSFSLASDAILNSKHEAIGVIYAGNKPSGESTRGFAVYFSPEIKKFITDNLDK